MTNSKRTFDFTLSFIMLFILSPLMFIIIITILFLDRGNPFFHQLRVGRYGKGFTILKYRTMVVQTLHGRAEFDLDPTNRVTALGKFLRKTKLDELPQLINILKGDMSFVGPRPEVPYWTEYYTEKWKVVHEVRPGLTDPASIKFRNEEQLLAASSEPKWFYQHEILPQKLALGVDYVRNRSFWGDIKILWTTFKTILTK